MNTHVPSAMSLDAADWASLRRAHFYVNDLFYREVHPLGVHAMERRLLDALSFAQRRGVDDGLVVSTICGLVLPTIKPPTALAALERLSKKHWVGSVIPGRHVRGRRWHLLPDGQRVRSVYNDAAEGILRSVHQGASEAERQEVLAAGRVASRDRDRHLSPVLDWMPPDRPNLVGDHAADWAALRRTHFYLSDLFYRQVEPLRIAMADRRILDALNLCDERGIRSGVTVSALCKLIPTETRAQTAASTLERLRKRSLVDRSDDEQTRPGRGARRWRIAPSGRAIVASYAAIAEGILRDTYGRPSVDVAQVTRLAGSAIRLRDSRLDPIVELQRLLEPSTRA